MSAMISWPSKIPLGEVLDHLAVNVDWLPTILDLCGMAYEDNLIEGNSLSDMILKNAETSHTTFAGIAMKNDGP